MIAEAERQADRRTPKILVPDASPLSLLGTIPGGLDWLFVPGCEIWIPDIVVDEVLRDPGPAKDGRLTHRAEIAGWYERNKYRIKRLETRAGRLYRAETENHARARALWEMAGKPEGLEPAHPDWRDRGDESVWIAVKTANDALDTMGESVIALVDDGEIRGAIELRGRRQRTVAIDLMGTQTFIRWMAEDFGVAAAETAWDTIALARRNRIPEIAEDEADPVYIRIEPPE
jgi:hypothetical protein